MVRCAALPLTASTSCSCVGVCVCLGALACSKWATRRQADPGASLGNLVSEPVLPAAPIRHGLRTHCLPLPTPLPPTTAGERGGGGGAVAGGAAGRGGGTPRRPPVARAPLRGAHLCCLGACRRCLLRCQLGLSFYIHRWLWCGPVCGPPSGYFINLPSPQHLRCVVSPSGLLICRWARGWSWRLSRLRRGCVTAACSSTSTSSAARWAGVGVAHL